MNRKSDPAWTTLFLLLGLLAVTAVNGQAPSVAATPPVPRPAAAAAPLNPVPVLAPFYVVMAKVALAQDQSAEAIRYYRAALRLQPDAPEVLNNLAWILATDDEAMNRDGAEALRLARRACELTQNVEPVMLSTLGAAYAENGQFADARQSAEAAIFYSGMTHQPGVIVQNRQLLKLYAAGRPGRQTPPSRAENLVYALFWSLPVAGGGGLVLFARFVRRRKASLGWPGLVVGNLLVLTFLLSFLPPAGETYYRFFYDATDSFGFTKVCNRWFQRHWQLNSSGCRDDVDYLLAPQPGKRRVTFVGDSFAAGQGIKNVEDRFANRLRRAHPEWDIQVLAQLGYDTGNELDYLKQNLDQGYQPDVVVLVYCLNDVSDLFPDWGRLVQRTTSDINQSGWLWRDSYLFNLLYYRMGVLRSPDLKNYFEFVRDGYRDPVWPRQQERLRSFRDLVQSRGGRLLVVTFPFVASVGPHYEFASVHAELDRFWPGLNVPHLDLLPVYRDLPPAKISVNRYDAHPNEFANQLAATAIDAFLTAQLGSTPQKK